MLVEIPNFTNLLNQVMSIKHDKGNFLLWQNIVIPILRSYQLEGHLTRATPPLDQLIVIPPCEDEPKGLLLPNLEYDIWLAADHLIVGWLYNSMTPTIVAQVMGHDEAKALWESIQAY